MHSKKPSGNHGKTPKQGGRRDADATEASILRVIGGSMGGRKISYSGDHRTRPMKDRVREALFNLLGPAGTKGTHAVDLFAGTGALGIEALSRGSVDATFLEKHFPTADLMRQSLVDLDIGDRGTVTACDTFLHVRRLRREGRPFPTERPWIVFCSPPYDFYIDRRDDMLQLLDDVTAMAPPQSTLVVEADARFDFASLPEPEAWRVREYLPAVVGIRRLVDGDA